MSSEDCYLYADLFKEGLDHHAPSSNKKNRAISSISMECDSFLNGENSAPVETCTKSSIVSGQIYQEKSVESKPAGSGGPTIEELDNQLLGQLFNADGQKDTLIYQMKAENRRLREEKEEYELEMCSLKKRCEVLERNISGLYKFTGYNLHRQQHNIATLNQKLAVCESVYGSKQVDRLVQMQKNGVDLDGYSDNPYREKFLPDFMKPPASVREHYKWYYERWAELKYKADPKSQSIREVCGSQKQRTANKSDGSDKREGFDFKGARSASKEANDTFQSVVLHQKTTAEINKSQSSKEKSDQFNAKEQAPRHFHSKSDKIDRVDFEKIKEGASSSYRSDSRQNKADEKERPREARRKRERRSREKSRDRERARSPIFSSKERSSGRSSEKLRSYSKSDLRKSENERMSLKQCRGTENCDSLLEIPAKKVNDSNRLLTSHDVISVKHVSACEDAINNLADANITKGSEGKVTGSLRSEIISTTLTIESKKDDDIGEIKGRISAPKENLECGQSSTEVTEKINAGAESSNEVQKETCTNFNTVDEFKLLRDRLPFECDSGGDYLNEIKISSQNLSVAEIDQIHKNVNKKSEKLNEIHANMNRSSEGLYEIIENLNKSLEKVTKIPEIETGIDENLSVAKNRVNTNRIEIDHDSEEGEVFDEEGPGRKVRVESIKSEERLFDLATENKLVIRSSSSFSSQKRNEKSRNSTRKEERSVKKSDRSKSRSRSRKDKESRDKPSSRHESKYQRTSSREKRYKSSRDRKRSKSRSKSIERSRRKRSHERSREDEKKRTKRKRRDDYRDDKENVRDSKRGKSDRCYSDRIVDRLRSKSRCTNRTSSGGVSAKKVLSSRENMRKTPDDQKEEIKEEIETPTRTDRLISNSKIKVKSDSESPKRAHSKNGSSFHLKQLVQVSLEKTKSEEPRNEDCCLDSKPSSEPVDLSSNYFSNPAKTGQKYLDSETFDSNGNVVIGDIGDNFKSSEKLDNKLDQLNSSSGCRESFTNVEEESVFVENYLFCMYQADYNDCDYFYASLSSFESEQKNLMTDFDHLLQQCYQAKNFIKTSKVVKTSMASPEQETKKNDKLSQKWKICSPGRLNDSPSKNTRQAKSEKLRDNYSDLYGSAESKFPAFCVQNQTLKVYTNPATMNDSPSKNTRRAKRLRLSSQKSKQKLDSDLNLKSPSKVLSNPGDVQDISLGQNNWRSLSQILAGLTDDTKEKKTLFDFSLDNSAFLSKREVTQPQNEPDSRVALSSDSAFCSKPEKDNFPCATENEPEMNIEFIGDRDRGTSKNCRDIKKTLEESTEYSRECNENSNSCNEIFIDSCLVEPAHETVISGDLDELEKTIVAPLNDDCAIDQFEFLESEANSVESNNRKAIQIINMLEVTRDANERTEKRSQSGHCMSNEKMFETLNKSSSLSQQSRNQLSSDSEDGLRPRGKRKLCKRKLQSRAILDTSSDENGNEAAVVRLPPKKQKKEKTSTEYIKLLKNAKHINGSDLEADSSLIQTSKNPKSRLQIFKDKLRNSSCRIGKYGKIQKRRARSRNKLVKRKHWETLYDEVMKSKSKIENKVEDSEHDDYFGSVANKLEDELEENVTELSDEKDKKTFDNVYHTDSENDTTQKSDGKIEIGGEVSGGKDFCYQDFDCVDEHEHLSGDLSGNEEDLEEESVLSEDDDLNGTIDESDCDASSEALDIVTDISDPSEVEDIENLERKGNKSKSEEFANEAVYQNENKINKDNFTNRDIVETNNNLNRANASNENKCDKAFDDVKESDELDDGSQLSQSESATSSPPLSPVIKKRNSNNGSCPLLTNLVSVNNSLSGINLVSQCYNSDSESE
ncbi:uncharacterized protein LOC134841153 isoform X2 [Symsagittifera roscoffensis]|uniref:uncharacterized protein LOC134841153 isoform X2 n=1 Tax=Symsagittifera roscoffensis TaxID=84072 RepID=UPI00307BD5BF